MKAILLALALLAAQTPVSGTRPAPDMSFNIASYVYANSDTAYSRGFPSLHITSGRCPFDIERNLWHFATLSLVGTYEGWEFENTPAELRGRGNSTWIHGTDKRPLRFRFEEPRPMFDSGYAHREWILLANHFDKSLLRNYFVLYLAAQMGVMDFVPMVHNLHLYVNDEYMGVYLLTDERRNIGIGRVDVEHNPDPRISGFLIETDGGDFVLNGIGYDVYQPPNHELTPEHLIYAENFVTKVSNAILSRDFEQINSLIDMETFVEFYIIQELVVCPDAHRHGSAFMHISGEGEDRRLFKGPLWDFDLIAGAASGYNTPEVMHEARLNYWFCNLMALPEFRSAVIERWNEIKDAELVQAIERVRFLSTEYQNEFERNFQRHQILGKAVWAHENSAVSMIDTFPGQVEFFVSFLETRISWLNYMSVELSD